RRTKRALPRRGPSRHYVPRTVTSDKMGANARKSNTPKSTTPCASTPYADCPANCLAEIEFSKHPNNSERVHKSSPAPRPLVRLLPSHLKGQTRPNRATCHTGHSKSPLFPRPGRPKMSHSWRHTHPV